MGLCSLSRMLVLIFHLFSSEEIHIPSRETKQSIFLSSTFLTYEVLWLLGMGTYLNTHVASVTISYYSREGSLLRIVPCEGGKCM